jgi:hypothetical protein
MGTVSNESTEQEKYITFKTSEFYTMMGYLALPPWRDEASGELIGTSMDSAPLAALIEAEVQKTRLNDAVVIRRQDLFASPCLATYAQMIALVAKNHGDPEVSKELLTIADYFEDQANLAAAEGFKLPTL